jgi:hypothetical protein
VPNFQRVNNERDIVPIVPGRSLGFQHPHGEIHFLSDTSGVACSGEYHLGFLLLVIVYELLSILGDDNAVDPQCQIMTVPNILVGNILNHLGPYHGINIGTVYCN